MDFGHRSLKPSFVWEWSDRIVRRQPDSLVGEEPLQIMLDHRALTVTMRTPGDDLELAAGLLFTEGIIQCREDLVTLAGAGDSPSQQNTVKVELRDGLDSSFEQTQRNFLSTASCGVCGKASLDAIYARRITPPNPLFRIDPEILCGLPEALRSAQLLFGRTGGLHAAALFTSAGELLSLREDVGRHNAVDKVIGWALMQSRIPLGECAMLVSGRGGFEIIQKALVAGIPVLASVSAASSLAVHMASEFGLTLVGFLRGRRFVVYCGESRLGLHPPGPSRIGLGELTGRPVNGDVED